MKVVIPAKLKSSRVPDKNWRPFHQDKCLVEIKIEQLLELFKPEDIYLSCDEAAKISIAKEYGIHFSLRNSLLAADATAWSDVVTGIVAEIPCAEEEEILWAEVTSPLFNEYSRLLELWEQNKSSHDSLLSVNEVRDFLIDAKGRAVNFNYGRWHCPSQELEPLYSMDSTFIMSKKNIFYFNYPVGKKPFLYINQHQSIEIDTLQQFEMSQRLFTEQQTV